MFCFSSDFDLVLGFSSNNIHLLVMKSNLFYFQSFLVKYNLSLYINIYPFRTLCIQRSNSTPLLDVNCSNIVAVKIKINLPTVLNNSNNCYSSSESCSSSLPSTISSSSSEPSSSGPSSSGLSSKSSSFETMPNPLPR